MIGRGLLRSTENLNAPSTLHGIGGCEVGYKTFLVRSAVTLQPSYEDNIVSAGKYT
jgi:hypothetical protein